MKYNEINRAKKKKETD